MKHTSSKYFRAPHWLVRVHQTIFFLGMLIFGIGLYFGFQIASRGDTVPTASRPYRAEPGKGTTVYYLSRADYFYCQQLPLIGFVTMLVPCVTFFAYGRWLARHHDNAA